MCIYECATVRVHFLSLVPSINERPRIADLQNYITPKYAMKWKEIGNGLEITQERINIIEKNNCNDCERQCNAMFSSWLEVKADDATWKKLLTVLDSPAFNTIQTDPAINIIHADPVVNIIQTNPTVNIIQTDPTANIIQTDHGRFTYVVLFYVHIHIFKSFKFKIFQ